MSETKRRMVIDRIKRDARRHHSRMRANADLSCGGALGDAIRGTNTEKHFLEYERCIARLRRIDPAFPRETTP